MRRCVATFSKATVFFGCVHHLVGSSLLICVVEDAIEVLLHISDSEPAQTVGQQEESVFLSPTVVPHSSTQNWSQHQYGHSGSYPYTTEWSEGTALSYPGTYGFQSGYNSQAHPPGRSVGGGASGYGDVYPSRYVNSSGGHTAYGYSEQQLWSSGVLGVGQQEVEASSLLDTPSSSGGSSVTSSPLHTPQVPAVSYSKACTASPKGTRHPPKAATTPPTKTSKQSMNVKVCLCCVWYVICIQIFIAMLVRCNLSNLVP